MNISNLLTKHYNTLKRVFKLDDEALASIPTASVSEIDTLDRMLEDLNSEKYEEEQRVKFLKNAIDAYVSSYSSEAAPLEELSALYGAINLSFQTLEEEGAPITEDTNFGDVEPITDELTIEDLENDTTETSFEEEFPKIDADKLLEVQYSNWLSEIKNKTFYKIVRGYQVEEQGGSLNFNDRTFLWKLLKAISSCITHLAIEVELHPESLILFEEYYDGLVACMNNVVHARNQSDVQASYMYMLDMLSLSDSQEEDIIDSM